MRIPPTGRGPTLIVVAALFTVALLLIGIARGQAHPAQRVGAVTMRCFPATLWSPSLLPTDARPCTSVARVREDGSGILYLGTRRHVQGECVIPNVREERGRFSIRCRRVAARPSFRPPPQPYGAVTRRR